MMKLAKFKGSYGPNEHPLIHKESSPQKSPNLSLLFPEDLHVWFPKLLTNDSLLIYVFLNPINLSPKEVHLRTLIIEYLVIHGNQKHRQERIAKHTLETKERMRTPLDAPSCLPPP
ncbi:hypothetical protein MTR_5g026073 [Medicago truncatula]|uniref:Uncharacterized protein n=1 Tax=Medicago truncatula TaxID=3880 RepID=A0A072UP78_MEDTR|nr:hypothetical protein MTR_5g026073 [Medicago truncatula]